MVPTSLLIALLLVVDSLHFVFARLLLPQVSPAVSVTYIMAIASLEMLVFALITGRLSLAGFRGRLGTFLAIGFLVAASTNINYEAVAFIDPGTASLLAQTGTIFGLGLGVAWLGDRLNKRQLAGAGLAIAGVFVMEYQAGEYLRYGSLLVLVSTFMYALHSAITKRFAEGIDFTGFFILRLVYTTFFLALFSWWRGALTLPQPGAWPLLILVATTDVVISRALYYLSLRRLSLSLHTLALTLSPLVAVLWALLLFDTFPAAFQLAGGAAVLAGVLLASLARHRPGQGAEFRTGAS